MHNVLLQNVLYVPETAYNLISVSEIHRKDFLIRIDSDSLNHRRGLKELVHNVSGETKMVGLKTDDGLYQAIVKVSESERAHIPPQSCSLLWHRRLSHCRMETLKNSVPLKRGL